jgi:hypothetical protein
MSIYGRSRIFQKVKPHRWTAIGLEPHGAHSSPTAPLDGGFQVKDSTPRAVWKEEGESSYSNSNSPCRFGKKGEEFESRNPNPYPTRFGTGAGQPRAWPPT